MPTKRFFCTICGRVKRVRHLPSIIQSPDAVTPAVRKGQCDRHFARPMTRVSVIAPVQPAQTIKKQKKVSA